MHGQRLPDGELGMPESKAMDWLYQQTRLARGLSGSDLTVHFCFTSELSIRSGPRLSFGLKSRTLVLISFQVISTIEY